MEVSLWQRRARFVAYIDLVLCSWGMLLAVIMIVLGVSTATLKNEIRQEFTKEDLSEEELNAFIWIVRILALIMAILVAIDMWAVIMLLKATKQGGEPKLALDRARIWRNVAIAFLIFSIVCDGASGYYIYMVVEILFRGILLFVVHKFMSALQQTIGTTAYAYAPPESIVVKH